MLRPTIILPRIRPAGLVLMTAIAAIGSAQAIDLQGHRGARGLAPENTLPAFALALSIGVTTLELDLAMTRDQQLVVMHDPRFEPRIARDASGDWLRRSSPAVRSMSLQQVRSFDVGRLNPAYRYATYYPGQKSIDGTRVPTLAEVFDLVAQSGNREVRFNIEIKINPERPKLTYGPDEFAGAVVELVRRHELVDRVTIQSFDWRALQRVQAIAPEIETAYLTVNQDWLSNLRAGRPGASPWLAGFDVDDFGGSAARTVAAAGGDIWSPYHLEVDAASIREAHDAGLVVNVWTVNDPARMRELIGLGVDGIITDYPDRLRAVLIESGIPVPAPIKTVSID